MAATSDVNVKMVTADRERKAKDLAGWQKEAFEFRKKLVKERNAAAREEARLQAGVSEDTDNRPILCCHKTMQPCAETGCSALCAVVAIIDLVMNVFGDTFDNAYYSVQLSLGMIKKMPKLRKKEDEEHDVEEAIPVEEQGDGCCYNTWINLFYYAIYGTILHGCTAAIFIVFLYLTQISTHNDAALWFNFCLFVVVVGAIGIGLIMGDAGMKEEALQEKLTSMRLELARSKRKLEAAERERADE